ncbi:MAG: thioredoxin [Planctomycetes bacterium]|nr:thioredoxin [Planctomycetota bacterium]
MASEAVVVVNDENFEEEVLEGDGLVFVDFWSQTCMPCLRLAPTIDALATEFKGRVKVCKAEAPYSMESMMRAEIEAFPTMVLYKKGEEVGRIIGAYPKDHIKSVIEQNLN